MKPESRCGGSLVVAVFLEECGKEVVGKLESLGKSIYTFENLELDPSMSSLYSWTNSLGILDRQMHAYS